MNPEKAKRFLRFMTETVMHDFNTDRLMFGKEFEVATDEELVSVAEHTLRNMERAIHTWKYDYK